MKSSTVLILAMATMAASHAAANDFKLEYRVERTEAAALSLDQCADIVRKEAAEAGYTQSVDRHPGQLVTVTGGPSGGGSSFIVHCIAVDGKTVSVVQAIDYRGRGATAKRFADRVHAALTKAGR
ncbi:DUF6180 family protein [Enterovirga rhinocerotis]|uniref:Uncharacterized protein n=1 Tax=Enterovirga rhinocerotis TaxID=1339210 RepID=A0A4R7BWB6_9HYPH|nr:DUF6180 family protein [Enterovirga rhinocerotis]TDR89861.1 hypothetical protein EV668_2697 [Enterovirga rhinocerotis]